MLTRIRLSGFLFQNYSQADSIPYTTLTERLLHGLADLQPRTIATAHGSSFGGDGARALRDLHLALRETFGSVGVPM